MGGHLRRSPATQGLSSAVFGVCIAVPGLWMSRTGFIAAVMFAMLVQTVWEIEVNGGSSTACRGLRVMAVGLLVVVISLVVAIAIVLVLTTIAPKKYGSLG
jgi:hypothetical protein